MSAGSYTDEILDPVVGCLTPDVANQILSIRLSPRVQTRVDELAGRLREGVLSEAERAEYESLIERADLLGIFKALARQALSGS